MKKCNADLEEIMEQNKNPTPPNPIAFLSVSPNFQRELILFFYCFKLFAHSDIDHLLQLRAL